MDARNTTNKTALYFEQYQKGLTVTAIAKKFGTSRETVNTYLKKHDKYKPRGRGNKLTKKQGRVITPPATIEAERINFYASSELLDRLQSIGGYLNRTDRLIAAIEDYLALKVKDRPQANPKHVVNDRTIALNLPVSLKQKLDREYKTEANKTRTEKIIAAIELFCHKHKVWVAGH